MSTVREQIVDAIKARCQLIIAANTVTVGSDVYTFQTTPVVFDIWRVEDYGDQFPAIEIRDLTDTPIDDGVNRAADHDLTVMVGMRTKGSTATTAARNLMADVLAAIGSDETLGSLVYRIDVTQRDFVVDEESNRYTGAVIGLLVKYRTSRWSL